MSISRCTMLRVVVSRVAGRAVARPTAAGRVSVRTTAPALGALGKNRRHFASSPKSDPRKHPRELDDDFEEVDPKNPNATGGKGEEQPDLPLIFDADPETFNSVVSTAQMPLIVLLHVPGQPQCAQLDANLQKFVLDTKGAVRMVRFDIAAHPEAAADLQVKSVPATLCLFRNRMVTSFAGVPNDRQLESVIEHLMRLAGAGSVKLMLDKANTCLDTGDIGEAAKIFSDILQDETLKSEAIALAGLARCALKEGKLKEAQEICGAIKERYAKDLTDPEVNKAIVAVELASNAGSADDIKAVEQKIKSNPNDPEARYEYGVKLSAMGKHAEAIDQLLTSIKKDKNWNDQAARKHLLKVIEALGADNDLAIQGRRRLSALWFA